MLSGGLQRASSAPRRFVRGQIELVQRSIRLYAEMDGVDRAMALAAQAFTALIPLVIVVAVATEGGHGKTVADQIVNRFGLTGSTATAVRQALPTSGAVQNGLSIFSILVLVISALSFTRALQRLYERAWGLEARSFRDTAWGIVWLGTFGLYSILHPLLHGHISGSLGLGASLVGGTIFWLITPYVILARRLPWRRLVPQAVLTAIGMAIVRAGSAIYMPHALASSAREFGTIGCAFTLVTWLFASALVLTGAAAIGASLSQTVPPIADRR
jgi:membrane protein